MINELSSIYQQLGYLVLEQGTLIDRIDYNIQETKQNVTQANVHLTGVYYFYFLFIRIQLIKKAVKAQESPTANRCIKILIIMILVFSLILTLRYTR